MQQTTTDRLLTLAAVSEVVGFKRTAIYQKIAAGCFPAPIKVGFASRWSERAVAAWVEAQKENHRNAA